MRNTYEVLNILLQNYFLFYFKSLWVYDRRVWNLIYFLCTGETFLCGIKKAPFEILHKVDILSLSFSLSIYIYTYIYIYIKQCPLNHFNAFCRSMLFKGRIRVGVKPCLWWILPIWLTDVMLRKPMCREYYTYIPLRFHATSLYRPESVLHSNINTKQLIYIFLGQGNTPLSLQTASSTNVIVSGRGGITLLVASKREWVSGAKAYHNSLRVASNIHQISLWISVWRY